MPETSEFMSFKAGDVVLIASAPWCSEAFYWAVQDGLWDVVSEEEALEHLKTGTAESLALLAVRAWSRERLNEI